MIIMKSKYIIVTKNFPLVFSDGEYDVMDIEDAKLYDDLDTAKFTLAEFDLDEQLNYQILPVKVMYEI